MQVFIFLTIECSSKRIITSANSGKYKKNTIINEGKFPIYKKLESNLKKLCVNASWFYNVILLC